MRKLTIKLTNSELIGLCEWLDLACERMTNTAIGYNAKCAAAVLTQWYHGKVRPKSFFGFEGKASIKLDAATAMALAQAISVYGPKPQVFIGNSLLRIFNTIDQHFQ